MCIRDSLAAHLDAMKSADAQLNETVHPVPVKTQAGQLIAQLPLRTIAAARWLVWLSVAAAIARSWLGLDWLPTLPWPVTVLGALTLLTPPGRMVLAAAGARIVLAGITPGDYPRGGKVHLRVWLAERLADELGAANISGAALVRWYARLLGAPNGKGAELHSLPPVTGHLHLSKGTAVGTEVDLTGHWIDGATLHLGAIRAVSYTHLRHLPPDSRASPRCAGPGQRRDQPHLCRVRGGRLRSCLLYTSRCV